ncbi:MAG: radical SAM protein [Thermoleophilaceae bacterium]|nr:radical SAM protein [Thermoleophilaceae bacterium]
MCEHVFVRWDSLKLEEEEGRALPGYRDAAAIRTFDAPEALGTRFYEVRSKSALNRVPKQSRMPFRWTINPYRGCAHACQFCVRGDTPILMSDGRTKPIADVRAGERVFGTTRIGRYRRYITTPVLDHWETIKAAYRIVLEDGTELVASGDHRFLTRRGWKHVTGSERGSHRRPHLTLNDKLLGTGEFAAPPGDWPDYRRGYLCGLLRGDGTLTYSKGAVRRLLRFRLALTDLQALARARKLLLDMRDVATREVAYGSAGDRPMRVIYAGLGGGVSNIEELLEWPRSARPEWCKGFLAGIFDAEGHHDPSGAIRICNTDPEIIGWTAASLRQLGFSYVIEDLHRLNGCKNVRLTGGLQQKLRFFLTVDPAIWRKRDIEGIALKSQAKLKVEEIEPLGRGYRLYDITTGTGDFIANGVVSHNCFARPTHTYLGFDAGRDFEREIVVKVNVPEVLRAELKRPSWKREHVAMGTNTDPYQWVEGRYKLMPAIWEALRDSGTPGSVLTKSPLLLRDIDVMKQVPGISASLSIPTLDEKAWRATEPRTPHPRARIEAVAELNRQGIPCGVLIAPLMPGINDSPEQVERILELCAEAGAVDVGGICLHLRGEVRGIFMDWLRSQRPDLVPLYERLYARGAYAPKAERERISALVHSRRLPARRPGSAFRRGARVDPAGDPGEVGPAQPEPHQESLF